jgi:hypothetical protein
MIRQPRTLKYRIVICSKDKLTSISKFISSMCFWIILKINFSNSLPVVDKRLIGRKFGEILGLCRVSAEL